MLGKALIEEGISAEELQVLLITNHWMRTTLYCQQLASPGEAVVWDYHVVLLQKQAHRAQIFDFDSTLNFPCSALEYLDKTFVSSLFEPENSVFFRQVPLDAYLANFHSDRKHMIGSNGSPHSPFPEYPPIVNQGERIRLFDYLDLTLKLTDTSQILGLDQLKKQIRGV